MNLKLHRIQSQRFVASCLCVDMDEDLRFESSVISKGSKAGNAEFPMREGSESSVISKVSKAS